MTKVDIFNTALLSLGQEPLSKETDKDRNGRACRTFYPLAAQTVLQSYEWTCALTRASLSALDVVDPDWNADLTGFEYQYRLPAGCLTVVSINNDREIPRQKERRNLYCNLDEINLLYVADISEPAQPGDPLEYSPSLADAISLCIAYKLAKSILKDKNWPAVYQEYQATLLEAQGNDAMDRTEEKAGQWIVE